MRLDCTRKCSYKLPRSAPLALRIVLLLDLDFDFCVASWTDILSDLVEEEGLVVFVLCRTPPEPTLLNEADKQEMEPLDMVRIISVPTEP